MDDKNLWIWILGGVGVLWLLRRRPALAPGVAPVAGYPTVYSPPAYPPQTGGPSFRNDGGAPPVAPGVPGAGDPTLGLVTGIIGAAAGALPGIIRGIGAQNYIPTDGRPSPAFDPGYDGPPVSDPYGWSDPWGPGFSSDPSPSSGQTEAAFDGQLIDNFE